MDTQQKNEVQELARKYREQFPSQAKAAAALKGVSEATFIALLKGRFEDISDEMFTTIGKQVGYNERQSWHITETVAFNTEIAFLNDAQQSGNVFAIKGNAGAGKSAVAKYFAGRKKNVFLVSCAEYYNKKKFLADILDAMGKDSKGYTVTEMMDAIVMNVLKLDKPLIIFDEFDKLVDGVFIFFITLYNKLEDKCGIVLMGTDFLEKRIQRGLRLNKRGYEEIYSRIGRTFIDIPKTTKKEITRICQANGVSDEQTISEIYNTYDGDLRRLERAVHKYKIMQTVSQ
jgi:DNA transposition AAA+ family ATPase